MSTRAALLILTCSVALARAATAAGIDCSRANSKADLAICADASLRGNDTTLDALYVQATRRLGGKDKAALLQSQRQWLQRKEACGADPACLHDSYSARIGELRRLTLDPPSKLDVQALDELRRAVEVQRKSTEELPLERALESVVIRQGMTKFENIRDEGEADGDAHFPTRKPPGVTKDEWEALKRSKVEGGGENGMAWYQLLDIDADGQRDLIVNSYSGGTGLYTLVSVLRRHGDRFDGVAASVNAEGGDAAEPLVSLNGRGSSDAAYWVRLKGRVYLAYRTGYYGVDHLWLLRPLAPTREVPALTVHYRYRLSVPRQQRGVNHEGAAGTLDAAWHEALNKAVASIDDRRANEGLPGGSRYVCPPPPAATEDEALEFLSFGPGHYVYEVVGDVPVWFGSDCWLGQLIDWFGAYGEEGLLAQLHIRKPGADAVQTFEVTGRRRLVKVETGMTAAIENKR